MSTSRQTPAERMAAMTDLSTTYTCPGCGERIRLTQASDLTLVVNHAKTCDRPPTEEVSDLPGL